MSEVYKSVVSFFGSRAKDDLPSLFIGLFVAWA
jgi:putative transposon-encoded protein